VVVDGGPPGTRSGTRSVRVALVLGSATGGVGRHVHSLVRGLSGRGLEVVVFSPSATATRFDFATAGARVVALEIPPGLDPRDVRAVRTLRRALRADPVDVVHAHGLRAGFVAALARPSDLPLVVTWHNRVLGGGLRAQALRAGERLVARSADVTLGASDDLVARARSFGADDVRLGSVAAPPLPEPARSADEIRWELDARDRPLVLSVGRLHPQKGYHVLVAAAARWRMLRPGPLVAIAGTGPSYRDLAGQILAARAPVTLLGHRDDVADLLGAADLAVVTSVWEARQLFAQEALTAGVPLVATDVGGLPDLVGDAARLVTPDDVDALDAAVRELLADPQLRASYAEAGRARATTWPTEIDTVTQVSAIYAELTGRPDRSVAVSP
jgi:glycosyltransferase involved in cell wall biosynthesis